MKGIIPEAMHTFNLYNEKNDRLLGAGDEVALPVLKSKTSTLSGGGILGDVDSPLVGIFESMEMDIPFRILSDEAAEFEENQYKGTGLTLRGSQQVTDKTTHEIDYVPMRVIVRGRQKEFNPGKVKQGETMDCSVKLEITYIMIEVHGKQILELDKFNEIFSVNGKDQLAKIRKMC